MTRINRDLNDSVEITKRNKRGTNEKYTIENDLHGNGISDAGDLRKHFGVRTGH